MKYLNHSLLVFCLFLSACIKVNVLEQRPVTYNGKKYYEYKVQGVVPQKALQDGALMYLAFLTSEQDKLNENPTQEQKDKVDGLRSRYNNLLNKIWYLEKNFPKNSDGNYVISGSVIQEKDFRLPPRYEGDKHTLPSELNLDLGCSASGAEEACKNTFLPAVVESLGDLADGKIKGCLSVRVN